MKTTVVIDDGVMARLKVEAAREGKTMSELIETALRRLLETPAEGPPLPELPTFHAGRPLVDVADRDALFQAMEER